MRKSDLAISIGICTSLLIHGAFVYLLAQTAIRESDRDMHFGPLLALRHETNPPAPQDPPDKLSPDQQEPTPQDQPFEAPAFAKVDILPPPPPPLEPLNSDFGEHDGKGKSINSSPGDEPLRPRKGRLEQAELTRNPGTPDGGATKIPDAPSQPALNIADRPALPPAPLVPPTAAPPTSDDILAALPPAAPARAPSPIQRTTPTNSPAISPPRPAIALNKVIGQGDEPRPHDPTPVPRTTPPAAPAQPAPQLASAAPSAPQPLRDANLAFIAPQPQSPSSNSLSHFGDPAPRSDQDSDAFSRTATLSFRAGKVDARFGRKFKAVRPQLSIKGLRDIWDHPDPMVVLKMDIDATGEVINVSIIKSSGSNEIDMPTYLAAFDFWVEPPKDAQGHPLPDSIFLTIGWD